MSDLNTTYGALFVGVLVSAMFFGVTMLQAFVYFQQYPSDRVWGKLAVCWLWLLDALHLAFSAHFVYYYLVINYDNPSALLRVIWSFKFRTIVDGLVVVSVHSLYTLRLWTLLAIDDHVEPFGKEVRRWNSQKTTLPACASRWMMRRIVPWFVSMLVLVGYGVAIVMCYETLKEDTFDQLTHAPFATYVPLICSTVIDAVIAGSLCYFLARCRTEFGAMNGSLRTLMVYTLNTGIVSSVCSLIAISMMAAFPNTFITIAIEFLVIKLYINSYLAMLNARCGLSHDERRTRPASLAYTPANASIALRDVVGLRRVEEKHLPFPREVVDLERKHAPCSYPSLSFMHSCSEGARERPLPRHSDDDFVTVLDLSPLCAPPERPDMPMQMGQGQMQVLRAPRISHPDVCLEHGVAEGVAVAPAAPAAAGPRPHSHLGERSHPYPHTLAARLALTPSPSAHAEAETDARASRRMESGPVDFQTSPSLSPRTSLARHTSSSSTSVPHAADISASTSMPSPSPSPWLPDYPSPPERALSPLRFGAPPSAFSRVRGHGRTLSALSGVFEPRVSLAADSERASSSPSSLGGMPTDFTFTAPRSASRSSVHHDARTPSLVHDARTPSPALHDAHTLEPSLQDAAGELPMVYNDAGAPRDRYTRMVRSARSQRRGRRLALFDERGVALMWGLHDCEERLQGGQVSASSS